MNTAAWIEPVGVYLVPEAEQDAYLVELWVRGHKGELDFAQFSQPSANLGMAPEQVAYLEYRLSDDGSSGKALPMEPQRVERDVRVAFFLHFLDTSRPLSTPWGPVGLPKPTRRPARLSFMEYVDP